MAAEIDFEKEQKAHESTYSLFTGLIKWGTILSVMIVLLVVILITS